jgi:tetratricopeptide (TPR) repeat protein
VGRRAESRRLAELWRDACSGRAQLVVVTGEPGIGKSRLVDEFRHWAARQGAVTAAARSYVAEGDLAFAPVVEWLRDPVIAARRGRVHPSHVAALTRILPELSERPEPTVTTTGPTAATRPTGPTGVSGAAEPGSRLQLFEAATRALVVGTEPVLLVADDLHAADPETLQFVHYLLRSMPTAPLLVVATARPADTDPGHPLHGLLAGLRTLDRCTELELPRLGPVETGTLARRLGHRLSDEAAERLHVDTEGNPLFVVESLRAGWPDAAQVGGLAPKVQAVLESRIQQLPLGARDLIGLAATAGSSVTVEVLGRASDGGEDAVTRDLDELWRRQLLLAAGADTYRFSHDKLREVAYRGLSPLRRRRNHLALARALQETGADRLDTLAGRIAAHLDDAGAHDDSVPWHQRAAVAAQRRYADADAVRSLQRAWEIVRGAAPSGPRLERELDVLTALPGPLAALDGYLSPRLGAVLDRAFEICRELGIAAAAPLVRAQAMAVLSRGDFDAALSSGAALRLRGEDDDVLAVEGDFVQGVAAAWRGELDRARAHLEAAIDRYRPEYRAAHLLAFAQDPEVLCLVRLAQVRVLLGHPDEGRRLRDRGLAHGRAIGQPFTLGVALVFAALIDLDLGQPGAARERASELEGLRRRIDAPPIRLSTDVLGGLVAVLDGDTTGGMARIDAALADPGRHTAPGLTAMFLRVRLAACEHACLAEEVRETARRLLDDEVRIWDDRARGALAAER